MTALVKATRRCHHCKRRKIKCDKTLPACSRCQNSKLACSGYELVLRFTPPVGCKEYEGGGKPTLSKSTQAKGRITQLIAARPAVPPILYENRSASQSFRLICPKPHPTDSSTIVSQMIAFLENADHMSPMLSYADFRSIPVRVSESECLRDAAAYWCACWVDFKHGRQAMSLKTRYDYCKALRSLQQAIDGPEAFKVETLAAITLARDTIMPDKDSLFLHTKGIVNLMSKRGPPNVRDPLDIDIARHNRSTVTAYEAEYGRADFLRTKPWEEAMGEILKQSIARVDVNTLKLLIDPFLDNLKGWKAEMESIRKSPTSYKVEASLVMTKLVNLLFSFEAHESKYIAYIAEEVGSISMIDDPEFFAGKRYAMDDLKAAMLMFNLIFAKILVTRIGYDLKALYDSPSLGAIRDKHRETCVQAWMLIPFLRAQDPEDIQEFATPLAFTFPEADREEREHLLDIFEHIYSVTPYRGQSRIEIATRLFGIVRSMTGNAFTSS